MSTLVTPNLLSPIGGESITTPTLTISWSAPSYEQTWFELFYCDNYNRLEEPDWVAIATVPSTSKVFVWRIPRAISSDRTRIGIRSRDAMGLRSSITMSSNLSINRSVLAVPQVISPITNGTYDKSIAVIIASDAKANRSFYQFYYSSLSRNIPLTSLGPQLPASTLPYIWSTALLPTADDYVLYASAIDRNGNMSAISQVSGINIVHEGYFIVDTLPPIASITIEGNSKFTRRRNVSVSIFAYDQATGPQAVELLNDTDSPSTPQKVASAATFNLTGDDGVKQVQAIVQDYGGNRSNDNGNKVCLIDTLHLDTDVVDFAGEVDIAGQSIVYSITFGETQALFVDSMFPRRMATIGDTPVCVAIYNEEAYVATVDAIGAGHLITPSLQGWSEIIKWDDVYVTSMCEFQGNLVIGMSNGDLYTYNGSTISGLSGTVIGSLNAEDGTPPIKQLRASEDLLYVSFDNNTSLLIFDGTYLRYINSIGV